jgi:excisionase family DNA binding protein
MSHFGRFDRWNADAMSHPESVYAEPPTALEPLLSVRAAAKYLSISPRTLYRLVAAGELHPVRVGARLRFDRADVRAYLERGSP